MKANLFEKNLCPHQKSRDKLPGSKKSRGQPKPRWYTARSVVVCPSTCNRTMYFGYATNSWWIDWIYHRMEKNYMDGPQPSHRATLSLPCLSFLSVSNNFLTLHFHTFIATFVFWWFTVLLFWLIIFCVPSIYALSHNIIMYDKLCEVCDIIISSFLIS